MEPGRYRTLILVVLLGAGLLYAGLFYPPGEPENDPPSEKDQEAEQRISGFTLNESISDTEVWLLRSPEARRSGDQVDLTSPRVVYRVQGDTRVTVTADQGSYSLKAGTLNLRGNVILKRVTKNQILETDTLHWNRPEGLVRTDSRVVLRMPRGVLRATGMRTHLREETVQFLSNVEFSSR